LIQNVILKDLFTSTESMGDLSAAKAGCF